MAADDIRLPKRSWRAVARLTVLGTLGVIAASWAFNYLLLFADGLTAFGRSMVTATVLPVLIGAPLLAVAALQREKARQSKRMATLAASYDSATGCLKGDVFSGLLEDRRRRRATPASGPQSGALLLLELDRLKQINARFGPEWSDLALKLVADAIRRSIRESDVLGRLETGEFGLFLPGASEEEALRVGERALGAVAAVYFAPGGVERTIELRIAGIVFESQLPFSELIRHAEEQLIEAESSGRGTIRMEAVGTSA